MAKLTKDDVIDAAPIPEADFLCTTEAARLADTSSENIRRLARDGRLPTSLATRAGRLFRRADVLALVKPS